MIGLQAAYARLPAPLQNAACTLAGWHIAWERYDGTFRRILAEYEARAGWDHERIAAYRDERLQRFVVHAATTVPFWRRRFRELRLDPREIRGLADLAALPILTKADVQAEPAAFRSEAVPAGRRRRAHTSGTTGAGLHIDITLRAIQEQWAVWWRYRHWHCIRRGTWCGNFGGLSIVPPHVQTPPFWRVDLVGRQLLLSGYHLSAETAPAYLEALRARRPPWLHGYPSGLALLARFLLERRESPGFPLRWITTAAENLLPQQRDAIERAFGVAPVQHYGLTERVANFSQCEAGALHVDEDFAAVEFLPGPSGAATIVGTNFSNPAMPLLRYRTGDLAVATEPGCACGRPGRIVSRLDGRLEDYVVLPGGAHVGRLDHIFKDLVHIREAQVHQAADGGITFRVVPGPGYTDAEERRLLREARARLGGEVRLIVERVEVLPRSAVGKLRFVISEMPGARNEVAPVPPRPELPSAAPGA